MADGVTAAAALRRHARAGELVALDRPVRLEGAESAPALPYSAEAEQAVLCASITGAAAQAAALLTDGDFYREAHRRLFRAIVAVLERGEPVDPVTLRDEIDRRGDLEAVGGVEYLSYLLDVVPTAANLDAHARIVREKAALRRLAELGTIVAREATAGCTPAVALLDRAREGLQACAAGATAATSDRPVVMTAAAITARPDLMQPPRTIAPGFAYSACLTLLSALPKAGKSTLLAALAAAVTRGRPFQDGRCSAGDVLWWSSDAEGLYRLVSRLQDFDADLDHMLLMVTRPRDFAAFLATIREHRPALAIVDTLAAAVAGEVTHAGAPDEWLVPLNLLRDTARDTDAAVVLSHHSPRSAPNRARDSNAIEAACDVVIGMSEEVGEPNRRTFDVRARWACRGFTLTLDGTTYTSGDGLPSLDARILAMVVADAGLSGSAIATRLGVRKQDVLDGLRRMVATRAVEDRGTRTGSRYYAVGPSSPPTVPAVPEPVGTAPEGTGSRPYRGAEPVPVRAPAADDREPPETGRPQP